jgi:ABC-type thiamin/hydroxymethylpyrimidine transport system permease subunit
MTREPGELVLGYKVAYSRKVAMIAGLVATLIAVILVLMDTGYANKNWKAADSKK